MPRIRIGERRERSQKPTITWKEWKKTDGKYLITFIFYPRKYPSYSIIFETEEYMVRRSLQQEILKEVRKAGWDYRKEDLYIVVEADGYYLEWDSGSGYEKREYGLRKRQKEKEEEELDIEL